MVINIVPKSGTRISVGGSSGDICAMMRETTSTGARKAPIRTSAMPSGITSLRNNSLCLGLCSNNGILTAMDTVGLVTIEDS